LLFDLLRVDIGVRGRGTGAAGKLCCFRASASCSKILNNKQYIISIVNSGHPLFFTASASCSKLLNDKNISIQQVFFKGVLGTRFGSLELKIGSLESVKNIIGSRKSEKIGFLESEKSGPLQVDTGYLTFSLKKPEYSEKCQGKLYFQGKRKLLKILNVKCTLNTVKNFRATLFFRESASCSKILNDKNISIQ